MQILNAWCELACRRARSRTSNINRSEIFLIESFEELFLLVPVSSETSKL